MWSVSDMQWQIWKWATWAADRKTGQRRAAAAWGYRGYVTEDRERLCLGLPFRTITPLS